MTGSLNYNTLLEIAKANYIKDDNLLELIELVNDIEYEIMKSKEEKTEP